MDWVKGPTSRFLIRTLIVLGIACVVWAAIGLFMPVRTTTFSGVLDSGKAYAGVFSTPGYNSLDGLLLLLAATVNAVVSIRLFQGAYKPLKGFLWAIFSGILLVSTTIVGGTPVVSWLLSIPSEIQHAIGTPYVKVLETPVVNIPIIIAECLIAAYIAVAFIYALLAYYRGRAE